MEKKTSVATLEVHSIFHTIQGEGPFTGENSIFIRTAGCNLQCPGCDTDYTSIRKLFGPSVLAERAITIAQKHNVRTCVITGGGPFRQQKAIGLCIPLLREYFDKVQIETNGTLPPPSDIRWEKDVTQPTGNFIVCSPKTGKVHKEVLHNLCLLKYVLSYDDVGEDGLPNHALGHPAKPRLYRPPKDFPVNRIAIQPRDYGLTMQNDKSVNACIKSVTEHGYKLSLQVHKIIGMP